MTLQELNQLVRNNLRQQMPGTYWVQAEISECKEHFSGHCYLELIQKKEGQDSLCAKARATIWASVWQNLKPAFLRQTGTNLSPGLQILAEVAVDFHELYGFSLVIKDIDPTYTLGDQARRRQEILKRLEKEGVIDQNKEWPWPVIPRRIAIISSPAAAGYQDFMRQLTDNEYGFSFYTALFPATMQGGEAPRSIIQALDSVIDSGLPFDVVVIIRGGGAVADLQCFDDYALCFYATQYPLPLLTGLGHDKDSSILDRVAHTSVKTPTAAAEHLIATLAQQAMRMDDLADRLQRRVRQVLDNQRLTMQRLPGQLASLVQQQLMQANLKVERQSSALRQATRGVLLEEQQRNTLLSTRLTMKANTLMEQEQLRWRLLEQSILGFSPEAMLKKGFSLTVFQGKALRSIEELPVDALIETRLADGCLISKLQSKQTNHE
ncbi:MAG: exodeoxyribonuclease VII large subunit [Bacteroidales bacterium]|jgi:exodeoxyribonuclease VII large subunit|nr:exodeoxyribonuclease VII large subunit [Bacteroidales bacterium]